MACNPDFIQYIIDQCSGTGEISVKKMQPGIHRYKRSDLETTSFLSL